MFTSLKKFLSDEGGNSTVSLVICAPLMVYMFALLISYGQAMYGVQVCENAAAAGARAASLQATYYQAQVSAEEVAKACVEKAGMGCTFETGQIVTAGGWTRKNMMDYNVTVRVKTAIPMSFGGTGIQRELHIKRSCPAMIEGG